MYLPVVHCKCAHIDVPLCKPDYTCGIPTIGLREGLAACDVHQPPHPPGRYCTVLYTTTPTAQYFTLTWDSLHERLERLVEMTMCFLIVGTVLTCNYIYILSTAFIDAWGV